MSIRFTQASVEISSTINLTNILLVAGVGEMGVYLLRRSTKYSIDSSKSASTSPLVTMPLVVWFTCMSQRYLHINSRTAHTSSSIPRATSIALTGGNDVRRKVRDVE